MSSSIIPPINILLRQQQSQQQSQQQQPNTMNSTGNSSTGTRMKNSMNDGVVGSCTTGSISTLLSSLQTIQQNAIQRECQSALLLHSVSSSSSSSSSSPPRKTVLLHTGAPPPPISTTQPVLSFRTGRPLLVKSSSKASSVNTTKTTSNATVTTQSSNEQWYYMRSTPMTNELKMDIQILQNRNYFDPKRFYKSSSLNTRKKLPAVLQVGTVIEGSKEYYNSRYTKKERQSTLLQEVMKDTKIHDYTINKYKTMQQQQTIQSQQQKKRSKKSLPHHFTSTKKPIFKKKKSIM